MEVPNLVGLTVEEATEKLEEAGLDIKLEETEEDVSDKTVTSQVPVEGMSVNAGTKIIVEYEK